MIHKSIRGRSASAIARSVEGAVREGLLAAGDRLPTVRALAGSLGVSPTTVAGAYRTLRRRGVVVAEGRRGTRVATGPPLGTRVGAPIPEGARDLATGNPDPTLLPSLGPALRRIDTTPHLYGEGDHLPELVRLASRQLRADGIAAETPAIVSGAMDGIERVLHAQLRPGDRVAVEDPGFTSVLDLCGALGLHPVPVRLDADGPLASEVGAALDAGVQALIVTPRAQNPSGAALSAGRVRELRRVLSRHPDVLVIEDDHAGLVAGAPARSLCDLHRARWAVVRSVSKALGPDLRLAVLAGDAETLARVGGRQAVDFRWVSFLLQRLVVALLSDPAARRRLRRAATTYRVRREALLAGLASRGVVAHGRSGLNVWVPVAEEVAVVQRLLESGWAVSAGERFRLTTPPAIRITTATLEPSEADRLAADVAHAIEPARRPSVA
jgi:DNA-binding transcriptional MocR family regulator